MNILNINTFVKKPYTVFIPTFLGYEYFLSWSTKVLQSPNIQFVIVDNGNQELVKEITQFPVFQTSRNIGCAGLWNLICNIGFNYYNLDQMIIGQEDGIFTELMISSLWDATTNDTLVGAYDRSFEFSLFGISKQYWNDVGMFDENFIYAGCEDNDYKHRSKLMGKRIYSLNYSADLNCSLTTKILGDQLKPSNEHNANYIKEKWGSEYEFRTPFNNSTLKTFDCPMTDTLRNLYECSIFPSVIEYNELLKMVK